MVIAADGTVDAGVHLDINGSPLADGDRVAFAVRLEKENKAVLRMGTVRLRGRYGSRHGLGEVYVDPDTPPEKKARWDNRGYGMRRRDPKTLVKIG